MYIKRIQIENIKCFGTGKAAVEIDLQRQDGNYAGWTVLAGQNGSGKSTLLRAIALALAGPKLALSLRESFAGWVKAGESSCLSKIELVPGKEDKFNEPREPMFGLNWTYPPNESEPDIFGISEPGDGKRALWVEDGPWSPNLDGWFAAGYGPFRHLPERGVDVHRRKNGARRLNQLVSLFREDVPLADAISWLKEIYLRRLEKKPGAKELEKGLLSLLDDGLLPGGMRVKKVDSDGLWVDVNGQELPLKELSDGYRTIAALVVDLARQLFETYEEFKIIKKNGHYQVPYPGVVMIDEIDAHLHVSWQKEIGFWLKSRFPAIQFIVTTHSPFICQAADSRGLLRLPAPGEDRTVEHVPEELFAIVKNGTIDEAVLTELFGLETSHSRFSENLREEMARLEVLVIKGEAEPSDRKRYEELSRMLPNTQRYLVQQALRTLQKTS